MSTRITPVGGIKPASKPAVEGGIEATTRAHFTKAQLRTGSPAALMVLLFDTAQTDCDGRAKLHGLPVAA
jgi:hypothetical protein